MSGTQQRANSKKDWNLLKFFAVASAGAVGPEEEGVDEGILQIARPTTLEPEKLQAWRRKLVVVIISSISMPKNTVSARFGGGREGLFRPVYYSNQTKSRGFHV